MFFSFLSKELGLAGFHGWDHWNANANEPGL
jgi:hypothetical protein